APPQPKSPQHSALHTDPSPTVQKQGLEPVVTAPEPMPSLSGETRRDAIGTPAQQELRPEVVVPRPKAVPSLESRQDAAPDTWNKGWLRWGQWLAAANPRASGSAAGRTPVLPQAGGKKPSAALSTVE